MSWVGGVPAGNSLVNLRGQQFETVRSLEIERDDPVRCEWRIRLKGPEEGDGESSDVSVFLTGDR